MAISVQKQFTVHIPSGQQASNQNVTIPAGKTMTITHDAIAARCAVVRGLYIRLGGQRLS